MVICIECRLISIGRRTACGDIVALVTGLAGDTYTNVHVYIHHVRGDPAGGRKIRVG